MKQAEVQRISKAPERIWLQTGTEIDEDLTDVAWGEVSWCQDKIYESDIEYVRIDRCKQKR
jgi:hypothetical protein